MSAHVLSRNGAHAALTRNIVTAIEATAPDGRLPWCAGKPLVLPVNAFSLGEFRGANVLALWSAARSKGYRSEFWATYKQWQSLGAQVRHSTRGTLLAFYRRRETRPFDSCDPDRSTGLEFVLNATWVFNAEQCDRYVPPCGGLERIPAECVRNAESFVDAIGVSMKAGDTPKYRPDNDTIEMPSLDTFTDTGDALAGELYYSALFRQLIRWTGPLARSHRVLDMRFGVDAPYVEELVVEIGAAFLCAALGITPDPGVRHPEHLGHWLRVLRTDSEAIFRAATDAQEAFDHLAYLAIKNEPGESERD